MNEKTKFAAQKDTWFRVGGSTSTITVPATTNGILAEKIRENLKSGGTVLSRNEFYTPKSVQPIFRQL
jgi:hypothetical protein